MARGGKRVQRARRAFNGGAGLNGGASGTGFAQSGGKATTFGGGKGGGVWQGKGGGNKGAGVGGPVKGKGRLGSSTPYKVRSPGGDNLLTGSVGQRVGSPPPLHASGKGTPNPAKRVFKKGGAARQRGGSTQ